MKKNDDMFSRFDTMPACDRRTDIFESIVRPMHRHRAVTNERLLGCSIVATVYCIQRLAIRCWRVRPLRSMTARSTVSLATAGTSDPKDTATDKAPAS